MSGGPTLIEVLRTTARLLTFRASEQEMLGLGRRHLGVGLLFAWACGIGRFWDHPQPHPLQVLGLGSVIYVIALSLLLWVLVGLPGAKSWGLLRLTAFVSLTSPPALLYAIPVERWVSFDLARQLNVGFLAVVAAWRVALYARYVWVVGRPGWLRFIVAMLLPLSLIIVALVSLNLDHVAFNLMAGLHEEPLPDPRADAYGVLFLAGLLSYFAFPITGTAWLVAVLVRFVKWMKQRSPPDSGTWSGD